jgi:GTPase SAR1 family protein
MYTRTLTPPEYSFFLFGPRSTGKTTWLRSVLSESARINLLDEKFLETPKVYKHCALTLGVLDVSHLMSLRGIWAT